MADRTPFPRSSAWDQPGFLLWHSTLRWQRAAAAALAPLNLTQTPFRMLVSTVWLAENLGEPPSQRVLADHTGADAMMTSQVVRALERGGLLSREQDPNDSRVKRLRTTDQGRAVALEAVQAIEQVDRDFFGDEEQFAESTLVLRRLAGRDTHGDLVDTRWQREP
ncbi:MarR family transcriptional regulator [soil metagenome]